MLGYDEEPLVRVSDHPLMSKTLLKNLIPNDLQNCLLLVSYLFHLYYLMKLKY
jgi:hypothetical protein